MISNTFKFDSLPRKKKQPTCKYTSWCSCVYYISNAKKKKVVCEDQCCHYNVETLRKKEAFVEKNRATI